jgi:seryl-tRNA synthetase
MLDIRLLRERPAFVREKLATRHSPVDLDAVLALDAARRADITAADRLKNDRNAVSKQIGARKKAGEDTSAIQAQVREMGDQIAALDGKIRAAEEELRRLMLAIPNLPQDDVPVGEDESANVVVGQWGEPKSFAFPAKDHVALGEALGLFDLPRGAKITGAGFPLFVGRGAKLERALIQFMLDLHTREHGFTEVSPPFVVNRASMTGTGQLPKLENDMYHVDADDLFLIPTAEVPVTNLYRDEILPGPLPMRRVAYTPCFRREAGAAGRDTRGIVRVHQFDKVEMVAWCAPEDSAAEHQRLVRCAQTVLERLGLTYRTVLLSSGDQSFAAAKCYDLEIWAPGAGRWLEISSVSNFEAFQARRMNIRYRTPEGRTDFVHTLNGSGVSLPRLVVALLENGQQEDGSVLLPEALAPYMGGTDALRLAAE